jgi:hypothetical protein
MTSRDTSRRLVEIFTDPDRCIRLENALIIADAFEDAGFVSVADQLRAGPGWFRRGTGDEPPLVKVVFAEMSDITILIYCTGD